MAQFARPSSDITIGDWQAPPLYAQVNEVSPDDGDFITAFGEAYCELGLGAVLAPGPGSVTLRVRFRKVVDAPESLVIATLMEGATQIAQEQFSVTSEFFSTGSFVLSPAEKAAITDWSNLRVRLAYAPASAVLYGASTVTYDGSPVTYA